MKNSIKKINILFITLILICSVNSCSSDDDGTAKEEPVVLVPYEQITLDIIKAEASNLASTPLVVVLDNNNIIDANDVILYKNSNGYYGKLEILQIDKVDGKYILTMRAVTYNQEGAILDQTPDAGITVREGFLCKLDPSIEEVPSMSTEADFRWQQKSAVDVDLLPFGSATFMLYK